MGCVAPIVSTGDPRPPTPRSSGPRGAVAIGVMTAVQARINGVLGVRVDNGIVAGFLSFAVGLVALAVVISFLPFARRGAMRLGRGSGSAASRSGCSSAVPAVRSPCPLRG